MFFGPSVQVAICSSVERIINKALQHDPGSRLALAKLEGKVLAVELTKPTTSYYFFPIEEGVRVQSIHDGEITTTIKGAPLDLLALAKSSRLNLADSGIEVIGNTAFLIELQSILKNLDIDWEDMISTIIGDIAGHEVGKTASAFKGWFGQRKQSFERLMGEFLTEEIQATPNKIELEKFYQQVDDLRLQVDRASAQIAELVKNKTNKTENSKENQ